MSTGHLLYRSQLHPKKIIFSDKKINMCNLIVQASNGSIRGGKNIILLLFYLFLFDLQDISVATTLSKISY